MFGWIWRMLLYKVDPGVRCQGFRSHRIEKSRLDFDEFIVGHCEQCGKKCLWHGHWFVMDAED